MSEETKRTSLVISSNKDRAILFTTGFVQVSFVSANTYMVSKYLPLAIFLTSFMISIVWTFNVKRVVFGTAIDRFLYALGASFGSLVGASIAFYFVGK